MSALPQFAYFFDQPAVPPPYVPPPMPASFEAQPSVQLGPSANSTPFGFIQRCMPNQQASPTFPRPELDVEIASECREILSSLDEAIQSLEHASPARAVGEFRELPWVVRREFALTELERVYVFDNRAKVTKFIERNRIGRVLQEAREPLITAFGEGVPKKLTIVEDDEGSTTLFCLILVPGDVTEARMALESFDQHWWLAHLGQAGGKLNFDFELI